MAKSNKPRYDESKWVSGKDLYHRDYGSRDLIWPGFRNGTIGALVSSGGVGKSYYAIQQAMKVATGIDEYTKRGGVLYLPAEDHIDDIGERVQSIAKAWELTPDQLDLLDANFHVWPLMGDSPDLLEKLANEDRPLVNSICSIAKSFKLDNLRLIIFDTLRRFSYADENSGAEMSHLLGVMENLASRLRCSCIYLHHATKNATLNGNLGSQHAARGSSVLTDNIRYVEYMQMMTEDEADKLGVAEQDGTVKQAISGARCYFIRWGVSKQNYGKPVPDMWYQRQDNGVLKPVQLGRVSKQKFG